MKKLFWRRQKPEPDSVELDVLKQINLAFSKLCLKLDTQIQLMSQPKFVEKYLQQGLIVGLDKASHEFSFDQSVSQATIQELERLDTHVKKMFASLKELQAHTRQHVKEVTGHIDTLHKNYQEHNQAETLHEIEPLLKEANMAIDLALAEIITMKEKIKLEISALSLRQKEATQVYGLFDAFDIALNELSSDLDAKKNLLHATLSRQTLQ